VACYYQDMNATTAVSRAPIKADPAPIGGSASDNSRSPGVNDADFASALGRAGAKPIRKTGGHTLSDPNPTGGQLPATGNPSPLPTGPAAAGGTAATGVAGSALTGSAAAPAGSAVASAPGAPAAPADLGAQSAATDQTALGAVLGAAVTLGGDKTASTGTGPETGPDSGWPFAPNAAGSADAVGGAVGVEMAVTDARAVRQTTPAGDAPVVSTALGAPAGNAGLGAGKSLTATEARVALNAATSAPSTTNGSEGPLNSAPSANADAASQAATAAGVVAENSGFAGAANISSIQEDLAASAADNAAAGVPGLNGAPAPAVAAIRQVAAAAAAPAANARAIAAFEDTGNSGKHTSSNSGDSLLPDASGGAAGAVQYGANAITTADATAAPTLKVAADVGTPEFAQGLADRVSWMVDNNLNNAKLQVNPPQLGPIEVRIAVQGDRAQVWLSSHSAVTREALESSSPKLREMLGAQGFGQVSVDISQRSFQERSPHAQSYDWTPSANSGASPAVSAAATTAAATTAAASTAAASSPRTSNGAVDAYA
jgi:flagellar hook-length control protein FliK